MLMERVDRSLDIRNIIESQVTLMTLLKRTMNQRQRKLFKYQRDMLPALAKKSSSDNDSRSSEFDVESKFDSKKMQKSIAVL